MRFKRVILVLKYFSELNKNYEYLFIRYFFHKALILQT